MHAGNARADCAWLIQKTEGEQFGSRVIIAGGYMVVVMEVVEVVKVVELVDVEVEVLQRALVPAVVNVIHHQSHVRCSSSSSSSSSEQNKQNFTSKNQYESKQKAAFIY
jgi:hypothetical protein